MKVLKEGVPIKLYGECGGCHAVVETDVKEARKLPGVAKPLLQIDCPTCQYPITLWPTKPRGAPHAA